MWSEELMANNNRLFRWGTSCRRRSRAEVVRSCGLCRSKRARRAVDFESLDLILNDSMDGASRAPRQKQSKSCTCHLYLGL